MARTADVVSHWHYSAEKFNTSSLEFYEALQRELSDGKAPVQFDNIEWKEGGLFSDKRMYLRISHNRFVFDICAAPFGQDYFFSWWMGRRLPENVLLYGCGMMFALPILFAICISAAGVFKGFVVFLVLLGVGVALLMNTGGGGGSVFEDALLSMPVVGQLYEKFFRPITYYSEDSRLMFEEAVHTKVVDIVDGLLAAKGARALGPDAKQVQGRKFLK